MARPGFDSIELPLLNPRTHCVLMARDPNFIYAYWDYTENDIDDLRNKLKTPSGDIQLVLRVYDTTSDHTWDLDVGFSAKNWYVQVMQDNADYCVELGVRGSNNDFIVLTRSNMAHTPPNTASVRNDLIWQDIKARKQSQPYIEEKIKVQNIKQSKKPKVYRLTSKDIRDYYMDLFARVSQKGKRKTRGFSIENLLKGKQRNISWQKVNPILTCPELIKRIHPGSSERSLEIGGASERISNVNPGASEGRLGPKKFFFEIWTELLVHGRTEADATVLLNQKGVKLNPDGTFSLRYALVDGEIPFEFIARSSDGAEERHINTRVEREKTISFPKTLEGTHGQ